MKQFLISFAGALAALWLTFVLMLVGSVVFVIALAVSATRQPAVQIPSHSILKLTLEGEIGERPSTTDFQGLLWGNPTTSQGLSEIVGAIDNAATNDDIEGIFIDCKGASAGAATLQGIHNAIRRFKKAAPDKWVYAYAGSYTQGDYYVASAADSIFINPVGQIDLHGLGTQLMYFKRLLDRLGVEMQIVKVGTYKSAVEPYMLEAPSEANIEQTKLFLGNVWNSIAGDIARGRKMDVETVKRLADEFVFADDATAYIKNRLADKVVYRHEIDERLQALVDDEEPPTVTPAEYCAAVNVDKIGNGKEAKIGVLYAGGEITENGRDGIASDKIVPVILDLAKKDEVDALVMRVNSPGGSAFASEQIWEAVEQYKKLTGKPVYVSMGDYAASGGYYISCGADRIFAQPTTLTGSIGIYGMIPNAQTLLNDKIGITTATVTTGNGGVFPNLFEPMTPVQAAAMQGYVNRGYELFTSRVARGRHMKQSRVKQIGEGRVWDGAQAKKLGLVDEIGDLDATVRAMAKHLMADGYTIETYPSVKAKWWEAALTLTDDIKAKIVEDELGPARELYRAVERLKNTSTLQMRMDEKVLINR